jgi:hypothetical protein
MGGSPIRTPHFRLCSLQKRDHVDTVPDAAKNSFSHATCIVAQFGPEPSTNDVEDK